MFRTNDTHLQEDLFNHYRTMKPSIAKMLEKSWAPVFYKEVFCKINEEIYAPLYCLDNGRPNTPVNILLSLEIIKHQFGFTDEEIIDDHIIENMLNWHHSGFNVYCGPAINPGNQEGLEKLAQYIIRAPLSQERLLYIPASEVPDGIARVIYRGKNSSVRESFMALGRSLPSVAPRH